MALAVGVRFRPVTKIYHFDPKEFADLAPDLPVIVDTARGLELGWVATVPMEIADDELKAKLKEIVRLATPDDLVQFRTSRVREEDALEKIRAKVTELQLPMKVIRTEYSFDCKRLLIMFIAEQRVDFRHLVRSLARTFRAQIEMRQIGARDQAKLIEGYGRCGRPLCCASWLMEFHPVSIRMAKNQDLPLAPSEISGLCGRLLCCLEYENEQYSETKTRLPAIGAIVSSEKGKGMVQGLNVIKESVIVELESEMLVEMPAATVTILAAPEGKPKKRKKSHS
jgi:cell fate regulator YaaT (PSP1 superfamily)